MRLALAIGTIVVTFAATAAAHPMFRAELLSLALRGGYTDPQTRVHACHHSRVAYWHYTELAAFEKHKLARVQIRLLAGRHGGFDKGSEKGLTDEAHSIESLARFYEGVLPALTSAATKNGCQPWP